MCAFRSPVASRAPSSAPTSALDCFAAAAPGLEALVAGELQALGIAAAVVDGGAEWRGDLAALYRANVWLRTASRVVVRVGAFGARGFAELERQANRLSWTRFLSTGAAVRLRVTSKKSRLYHTGAIAERLAAVIERCTGARVTTRAAADDDASEAEEHEAQLVIVRLHRDRCTISADSSGRLLHFRGYRQAIAKAPLRETLAAAVVLGSGWTGDAPLLDPLCGSGTIPIEAALIARRIAPGLRREFAFTRWASFDAALWKSIRATAAAHELPRAPVPILGSDRDVGAIAAAGANAERAGVAADVALSVRPLSAIEPPAAPGWLVVNPPYGQRIGDAGALRNLYAQLGHVARRRCAGWQLALLCADERLQAQVGIALEERLRTSNGGIPVRLLVGPVPPEREELPAR